MASRTFFALLLVASATLGGCGRRGPLELPPGTPAQAKAQDPSVLADKQATALNQDAPLGVIQSPSQVIQTPTTSAQLAAQPAAPAINGPAKAKPGTFLLDPLL